MAVSVLPQIIVWLFSISDDKGKKYPDFPQQRMMFEILGRQKKIQFSRQVKAHIAALLPSRKGNHGSQTELHPCKECQCTTRCKLKEGRNNKDFSQRNSHRAEIVHYSYINFSLDYGKCPKSPWNICYHCGHQKCVVSDAFLMDTKSMDFTLKGTQATNVMLVTV